MNAGHLIFTFCVFISVTCQGLYGYNEDNNKSEESLDAATDIKNQTDVLVEGPLDSHEAMNNRELKPKLTTSDRKKRSYQFLMGLIKRNNSSYEITNEEKNIPGNEEAEAKGSELLLELMIKIAENPEQWNKVHNLLQKIDNDLLKSKEIIQNLKKKTQSENETPAESTENVKWIRGNETVKSDAKNVTESSLEGVKLMETTKYPWPKPSRNPYQNFAYHRVTGNPLIHSNLNKKPKAYIAVSVIAPKPLQRTDVDELTLENELKELKPWTHEQNLKNMAQIRSRWVIQSNDEKLTYAP